MPKPSSSLRVFSVKSCDEPGGEPSPAAARAPMRGVHAHLEMSKYEQEYEQLSTIGGGAFGTVFKAKHKLEQQVYAVKRIRFLFRNDSLESSARFQSLVFKETRLLARLQHAHVARYYTYWVEKKWVRHTDAITPRPGSSKANSSSSSSSFSPSSYVSASTGDYSASGAGTEERLQFYDSQMRSYSLGGRFALREGDATAGAMLSLGAISGGGGSSGGDAPAEPAASGDWERLPVMEDEEEDASDDEDEDEAWAAMEQAEGVDDSDSDDLGGDGGGSFFTRAAEAGAEAAGSGGAGTGTGAGTGAAGMEDHMLQFDVYIQMQLYDTTLTAWMLKVSKVTAAAKAAAKAVEEQEATTTGAVAAPPPAPASPSGGVLRSSSDLSTGRSKASPLETCMHVFEQLVQGLEYVHRVGGMVHRDLKPANIFLDITREGAGDAAEERQHAIIGDFGLAEEDNSDEEEDGGAGKGGACAAKPGAMVGTPMYASPEQLKGCIGCVSTVSDTYSLGLIFFEMLAAHFIPFGTAMERHLALGDARGGKLPAALEEVAPEQCKLIRKMVCEDQYERLECFEVKDELARIRNMAKVKKSTVCAMAHSALRSRVSRAEEELATAQTSVEENVALRARVVELEQENAKLLEELEELRKAQRM